MKPDTEDGLEIRQKIETWLEDIRSFGFTKYFEESANQRYLLFVIFKDFRQLISFGGKRL